MDWDMLAKALDAHKPDWFISFSNEQELKDFTRRVAGKYDSRPVSVAVERLRSCVVRRLFEVVSAAVHSGHVMEFRAPHA